MANFLFYRYKFVQGPSEASLFPVDSDEPLTNEFHNRRFKDDLQSKSTTGTKKLTLYATIKERNGDTRTENYENEILNFYEGVCMLRVRNNKSKKFKKSRKRRKTGGRVAPSFPFCGFVLAALAPRRPSFYKGYKGKFFSCKEERFLFYR